MCWFLLYIHFSTLQPLSRKVTFSGTQETTPPSFNLQASDWVHSEEETGAYYQLARNNLNWLKNVNKFLKLLILLQKIMSFSNNSLKFIIQFFFKNSYLGKRIYVLNAMITSNILYL